MTSNHRKGRGRSACAALLVFAALALPAWAQAQSEPSTGAPDYLSAYPAPERVRADIVAAAGDAKPEEIEGRVEGRLRTLANALEHSWQTVNRFNGEPIHGYIGAAPPAARQLHRAYETQAADTYRKAMREYPDCGFFSRLLHLTGVRQACKRLGYSMAKDDYNGAHRDNAAASGEIAALYFPEKYRELFVEVSGGDHKYASRHQAVAGWAQRGAKADPAGERGAYKRSVALKLGLVSLVPFVLGVLLVVKVIRLHRQLDRYEFDHRTSGGVVQFRDYEAAEAHRRKRWLKDAIGKIAGLLLGVGVLGLSLAATLLFHGS